jgi:hypothetical protein
MPQLREDTRRQHRRADRDRCGEAEGGELQLAPPIDGGIDQPEQDQGRAQPEPDSDQADEGRRLQIEGQNEAECRPEPANDSGEGNDRQLANEVVDEDAAGEESQALQGVEPGELSDIEREGRDREEAGTERCGQIAGMAPQPEEE